MRINLRNFQKTQKEETFRLSISERLPFCCTQPCTLEGSYHLTAYENYYLLELKLTGEIALSCQRCLEEYRFPYAHEALLAICSSEAIAEQLMPRYETLVEQNNQIDLVEIITDELHLSLPKVHTNSADCNEEIARYIQ